MFYWFPKYRISSCFWLVLKLNLIDPIRDYPYRGLAYILVNLKVESDGPYKVPAIWKVAIVEFLFPLL